jgi:hypothetical protein
MDDSMPICNSLEFNPCILTHRRRRQMKQCYKKDANIWSIKAVWFINEKKINEKENWPASSPTQAWSPSGS